MADISLAAFERYMTHVRSPGTARKYARAVGNFLEVVKNARITNFEDMPLGTLNDYVQLMASRNFSPSTIHVQIAAVQRYLRWVRDQGIAVPQMAQPDLPRKQQIIRDTLPSELFPHYLKLADELLDEPIRTAVMLMPCCGLRCHEMAALPLTAVKKSVVRLNGQEKLTLCLHVRGKGGGERPVPLLDEGVQALTGYLAGWRRGEDGGWVFPGRNKKSSHVSDRALRYGLERVRAPLKLTITPHTMRRTYLTTLHRRGVDAPTLAKIAGHKNIQTLFQHYLMLDESDVMSAVHSKGSSLI